MNILNYTIGAVLACGIFAACSTQVAPLDTQAHRGGRGLMPENTIPAMLHAIDLDVTTLELDLQISKDLKVVVSHDPNFNADITTTPEGEYLTKEDAKTRLIYTMPYDSIAKYDVGLKEHPDFPEQKKMEAQKPLLSDLIAASEAYAKEKGKLMNYNIEIKSKVKGDSVMHPLVSEFVDLAMTVITDGGIKDRTTIQSFDVRALQYLHEKYPDVTASYLIGKKALDKKEKNTPKELFDELGFVPQIFSVEYTAVTPELIKECHDMGVKVIPWTVNKLEDIQKMKDMDVDGIITDYPNLFDQLK